MKFHVVLNRPVGPEKYQAELDKGLTPRHATIELAKSLDAVIHDGTGLSVSALDRLLGRLTRMNPLWWAIARDVRSSIKPGDVVFCSSESVGVPVAMLCGGKAAVTMLAHSVDSQKKRLAFKALGTVHRTAMFFAVSQLQVEALRKQHGVSAARTLFLWDQTDTRFFTPGPAEAKPRPLIVSIGLERRDYRTLAAATHDLDADVKISGFSADTRASELAFPPTLPRNMTRAFYPWTDLRALYRSADMVVVSLFPNTYAAGVQGLMEALSCGTPVIVTSTQGLAPYLSGGAMRIIDAGDPIQMRSAIEDLLASPDEQARLATNGRRRALELHSEQQYVNVIAGHMRRLAAGGQEVGAPPSLRRA